MVTVVNDRTIISEDNLLGLPAPVQRYLRYSGVIGKTPITTAFVRYTGRFRTKPDQPWMRMVAKQTYTVNPPGFAWRVRFKFAGIPFMFGSDTYKNGHSRMIGKLLSLFTVVDGHGDEVDQGTMARYLQEMIWFPTAYLSDYVTWQAVDDHVADATFTAYGKSITGRMFFDDTGRFLNFSTRRYGEFAGNYEINTWTTPTTVYREFSGFNLPAAGSVVWQLPEGDFPYVEYQLEDVVYDDITS